MRNSPIKTPEKYCFREYKIKSNEDARRYSFAIHSLRNTDSPLMKTYEKSKQLLGLKFDEDTQGVTARKNGKIVLIGGSISRRNASPPLKPNSSRLKAAETGKTHHRHFIRQKR